MTRPNLLLVVPDGGDRLILVTCFPFDTLMTGGSKRLVVIARRADRAVL